MHPKREDITYAYLATNSTPRNPKYQCQSYKQLCGRKPTFLPFSNSSPWSLSQLLMLCGVLSCIKVRVPPYGRHAGRNTNLVSSQIPPSSPESRRAPATSIIDPSFHACQVEVKRIRAVVLSEGRERKLAVLRTEDKKRTSPSSCGRGCGNSY
jgi:hypothetical protein